MKSFTIANLKKDGACKAGMAFVTPLIKAKKDVAKELLAYPDWFRWAVENGYKVGHCRSKSLTWTLDGGLCRLSVTSGKMGTSTSGYGGTSTSGNYGTSISGDYGTSTSGDYGTSTSGHMGTSTSGHMGTSTSGNYGTSISGDYGTSTSGCMGKAQSGLGGTISILWYDRKKDCYRRACAEVDGKKIKADTLYEVKDGKFVEVKK